jgi:iron complex outermembrane receptor protein
VARNLGGRWKGTLSLGLNGRAPTASELFGFYLFSQFDGYDYIGNPELKKETAQQAELSVSWQHPKWKLQATGYVSRVNNYIIGRYQPSLSAMTMGAKGVKQYENMGYALLAGGEAGIVFSPFTNTQVVSTLKYSYARDDNKQPLPMIAPLRNLSSVRQSFKNFWLQAETEMAAKQDRVSMDANERVTGAFSLFHFRAGYELKGEKIRWQFKGGVENILDAYYREHLDWGNIARPGRNFYLQVSFGL